MTLRRCSHERARFSAGHVGIGAAKIRGDGIRITECRHAGSGQRAFHAAFVHDDADNFWARRVGGESRQKFLHHVFAVGHLFHVGGRNETDRVDVLESGGGQRQQILDFSFRRNNFRQGPARRRAGIR